MNFDVSGDSSIFGGFFHGLKPPDDSYLFMIIITNNHRHH